MTRPCCTPGDVDNQPGSAPFELLNCGQGFDTIVLQGWPATFPIPQPVLAWFPLIDPNGTGIYVLQNCERLIRQ